MILLQQMIVLFIYMIIGYALTKGGILDARFSKTLSWLVVYVANVALVISSVVNGDGSIEGQALLLTAAIAVVMFAALILIAQIVPLIFRVKKEDAPMYKMMTIFNNIGYMGFPIIAATYGTSAVLYAAIFIMVFNILVYTYGISVLKGGKGGFSIRSVLNAGVISCVAAIILYVGQIPTPAFFNSAVEGLSGLTAPLSMIVIGISLAGMPLRKLVTDVRLILFSLVKLLVLPVLGMLIINLVVASPVLRGVCLIMLATPCASMVAMLAQQYDSNTELAARGVALTTILSVVTIPIVSALVL